jgi:hypothetical protein
MAVFWVVAPCSLVEAYHARGLPIALMMETARTSEMLVIFYQTTRRYNPEDSHLCTHRCDNLKSYWTLFNILFHGVQSLHKPIQCYFTFYYELNIIIYFTYLTLFSHFCSTLSKYFPKFFIIFILLVQFIIFLYSIPLLYLITFYTEIAFSVSWFLDNGLNEGYLLLTASIIRAISERSVNFYQTTQCNNPECSHLHTCRRENLKSHTIK